MERTIRITMHAPLGPRHGTLRFSDQNGSVSGTMTLLGSTAPFAGRLTPDGGLTLAGELTSGLQSFSYLARGRLTPGGLELTVCGGRYSFGITGEEILSQEELNP